MRIVLLALHAYPSPQAVPLANACLMAYAQRPASEIVLHDLYVGDPLAQSVAALLALQPSAIGFSLYTWNRADAVALAQALRQANPKLILFAGGPESTADPSGMLQVAPFDLVIVGEGEVPFAALCARLAAHAPFSGIPGLLLRDHEAEFVPQPPLSELDSIPSPWLSKALDAGQVPGVLWQLARGCSFACDFCYDARDRSGVRRFSLARAEAELRHFVAKGVSQVFVLDSTFNQDLPRAKTILRLIKQHARHIHFHFEVRSEFLDRELAQLFAEIFCSLQIGLQSADPQVLKAVGRAFKREEFVTKIQLLNRSGATFGFDLMIGLPGDTLAGFRISLDFALSLYPNQLDIFPLALLPGTALAARAAALHLSHLPQPPYTVLATPTFSEFELAQARQLATACDLFYSRGKAVAWFNGVVKALGDSPSEFLSDFSVWLAARGNGTLPEPATCSEAQIWQWQRDYLTSRFNGKLQRQQAVVLDLVDYHYHYAQTVQSPVPTQLPTAAQLKGIGLLSQAWRLAPTVRIVSFHYDILALLASGEPQPRRLSEQLTPQRCTAILFPTAHGVQTEPLEEEYIRLLRQLDGKTPVGQLVTRLKLDQKIALDFLRIAAGAGIIR